MNGKAFFSAIALGVLLGSAVSSQAVSETSGLTIANNTPRLSPSVKDLGAVDPSTSIEVSIWLSPHNKPGLDAVAKELYDAQSPNYRHWLTRADFASRYAPSSGEAKIVQEFFTSHSMKIVSVGPNNFYVRARGTAAAVSSAFHVSLRNFEMNGKTVRANTKDPFIMGEAAPLVAAVAGLDSLEYSHPLVNRTSRVAGSKVPTNAAAAASVSGQGSLPFNSKCFTGKRTESMTTAGSLPSATYTGNGYTSDSAACGYTPQNIQDAYNLTSLHKDGYDGTGQTIVIVDWCGSPTIMSDANAFSSQFGLPKLTSSNFKIIYTPSPSFCQAPDPEINIDVEWAHAIAPGAAIDLVVPPSASFQDVDQGVFYAVNYQLGNVLSGSYGSEEYYTPVTVLETENLIAETAAVLGISLDFSTGDDGDYTFDYPQYDPASVIAPADSPYATGVGGISLALNANNSIAWQSGWGTNEALLDYSGEVFDPPNSYTFFNFGSGGGSSAFFAKPSYQHKLKGPGRQLPDISWLADPFTGAYIAISEPFTLPELTYQVYGGTSLACPMFSALWAIANQVAGQPLGQAAPYLYSMPASTIMDILPLSSKTNVTGKVVDSQGTTTYTAAELAAPLEGTTSFVSALWDIPLEQDTTYLLTFGTDSGLKTAKGWDNVTGLGVPDGKAFAEYFKP